MTNMVVAQTRKATLSEDQAEFVEKYVNVAILGGAEHGMPWQTAMAQAIVESGAGTSRAAVENHNFHGIGSTIPGRAYKNFESDSKGWEGYYHNLEITPAYAKANFRDYAGDPKEFLSAIIEGGYNSEDESYERKVDYLIDAVEDYRIEKGWPTSAEYAKVLKDFDGELDEKSPISDYQIYTKNLKKRSAGPSEQAFIRGSIKPANEVSDKLEISAGEAKAEKSDSQFSAGAGRIMDRI